MHWELHREDEAASAFERAAGLLADRPPSPERASALAALGHSLMLRDHPEAEATLREAIACAESIGAHRAEAHARASLGLVQAELGRADEGVATMRRALEQSRAHGTPGQVARCHANLIATLLRAGAYEEVLSASVEALDYCAGAGQLGQYGEAITALRIVALTYTGRWSEAARVDAELRARLPNAGNTTYANYLASRRLLRRLWAGELDAVVPEVDRLLEVTADASTSHLRAVTLFRSGELAWGQRRWDHARAAFDAGLQLYDGGVGQFYVAHGLASAMGTEADRALATAGAGPRVTVEMTRIQAVADGLAQRVAALRARVGRSLTGLLPEPAAWLAVADAEYARVSRTDTAEQWRAVADGWDQLGVEYPAAVARWRAAEAALRVGDGRKAAAGHAANALDVAERLGAARLANELRLLEQRARLDLEHERVPERHPRLAALTGLGVTRREAEVLDLLASGRTNRQIAETLYISEKTASVHVTNLLRKLGVTNRIEAAAIAQRLGDETG
jgi:DNA-binding CsgD family transcriptional regulator